MYEIISGFKMLVLLTVSESQDIDKGTGLKVKSSIQYGNALPKRRIGKIPQIAESKILIRMVGLR